MKSDPLTTFPASVNVALAEDPRTGWKYVLTSIGIPPLTMQAETLLKLWQQSFLELAPFIIGGQLTAERFAALAELETHCTPLTEGADLDIDPGDWPAIRRLMLARELLGELQTRGEFPDLTGRLAYTLEQFDAAIAILGRKP